MPKISSISERKNNRTGWTLVAAASALLVFFNIVPVFQALYMSLFTGKGNKMVFGGANNYLRMLTDQTLHKAFFNTVLYLVVQVPIMVALALILASLLQSKDLRFKGLFRTALFLPCITSSVSYALIIKSIFANQGLFNMVMMKLGLLSQPIPWLTDPVWAKVLIIIAITWRWTGYNMVFFVAGLQNIDPQIYEAAQLDGVPPLQCLLQITVPLLKPIVLFTTITSTVGTLQLFDEVVNITNGGPANATMTVSQYVYNLCFRYVPEFGYATAVSIVVIVVIALLSALQFKVGEKND